MVKATLRVACATEPAPVKSKPDTITYKGTQPWWPCVRGANDAAHGQPSHPLVSTGLQSLRPYRKLFNGLLQAAAEAMRIS
jgi:hypothetical protein